MYNDNTFIIPTYKGKDDDKDEWMLYLKNIIISIRNSNPDDVRNKID